MSDADFIAWVADQDVDVSGSPGKTVKPIPAEWNYYGGVDSTIDQNVADATVIGVETAPRKNLRGCRPRRSCDRGHRLPSPKGTPKEDSIAKVNADVERILAMPDVKEKGVTLGYRYFGGSPEKLDAFLKHEIAKWAEVAQSASSEMIREDGLVCREALSVIPGRRTAAGPESIFPAGGYQIPGLPQLTLGPRNDDGGDAEPWRGLRCARPGRHRRAPI